MRRVEQFWAHSAKTWTQRATLYEGLLQTRLPPSADIAAFPRLVEDEHLERVGSYPGKIAYARRQATLRETLRDTASRAHGHLLGPLLLIDKGDGVVVDGTVMIEGKGRVGNKGKAKRK